MKPKTYLCDCGREKKPNELNSWFEQYNNKNSILKRNCKDCRNESKTPKHICPICGYYIAKGTWVIDRQVSPIKIFSFKISIILY